MRIQGAGGGLAVLLLVVSTSDTLAAGVHPESSSVQAAKPAAAKAAIKATTSPTILNAAPQQSAAKPAETAVATAAPTPPPPTQSAVAAATPAPTAETKTAAIAKPKPAPILPTLRATIDLTSQRMTVASSGRHLYTWRISSGRRGYETPRGSFRPGWMAKQWYSRKYNMSPMPYSVFFNGGIATHGTSAVSRLGRTASHGCVRLHTANARRFYHLVRKHGMSRTRIVVTGKSKHPRYAKRTSQRRFSRRRSLGVVSNRRMRYTARSYNRTPYYRPRARAYRARSRRLIYPGDRY